jgi:hypothetical protein
MLNYSFQLLPFCAHFRQLSSEFLLLQPEVLNGRLVFMYFVSQFLNLPLIYFFLHLEGSKMILVDYWSVLGGINGSLASEQVNFAGFSTYL